jgi:DNA primase catalytic subunit
MKIPNEGYFSKFTHVELARYFPEENRLKRVQNKKHEPILIPWSEIYDFSLEHDDLGIYHSIRHYDMAQGGLEGPSLAPLHFDIDNKEDPQTAYNDTQKLLRFLIDDIKIPYEAIRVYFSGMKGYHLEVESTAIRLNLISENSSAIFRFAAEEFAEKLDITSFDYAVYDPRRIWRLAGSRHQKTGLYKIPCKEMMLNGATVDTITSVAEAKPKFEDLAVPEQEFSPVAARFFAEMVATYEDTIRERKPINSLTFYQKALLEPSYTETLFGSLIPTR